MDSELTGNATTNASPRPRRKYWRWLLVGLLAFIGFNAFLGWPRGDERFVGKWTLAPIDGPPDFNVTLLVNGIGSMRGVNDQGALEFAWRAEGDWLFLGSSSRNKSSRMFAWVAGTFFSLLGSNWFPRETEFRVVEESAGTKIMEVQEGDRPKSKWTLISRWPTPKHRRSRNADLGVGSYWLRWLFSSSEPGCSGGLATRGSWVLGRWSTPEASGSEPCGSTASVSTA